NCCYIFENLLLLFAVVVISGSEFFAWESSAASVFVKRNKATRMVIRERTQEDGIDHAKDGCRCTNAERQRKGGNDDKARVPAEHAQTVTDIRDKVFNRRPVPHAAQEQLLKANSYFT